MNLMLQKKARLSSSSSSFFISKILKTYNLRSKRLGSTNLDLPLHINSNFKNSIRITRAKLKPQVEEDESVNCHFFDERKPPNPIIAATSGSTSGSSSAAFSFYTRGE